MDAAGPKPFNHLPREAAADLFERSINALGLELLAEYCPAFIVDETVQAMRSDFDHTRAWIRKLERGAVRLNQFGRFRSVRFARMSS